MIKMRINGMGTALSDAERAYGLTAEKLQTRNSTMRAGNFYTMAKFGTTTYAYNQSAWERFYERLPQVYDHASLAAVDNARQLAEGGQLPMEANCHALFAPATVLHKRIENGTCVLRLASSKKPDSKKTLCLLVSKLFEVVPTQIPALSLYVKIQAGTEPVSSWAYYSLKSSANCLYGWDAYDRSPEFTYPQLVESVGYNVNPFQTINGVSYYFRQTVGPQDTGESKSFPMDNGGINVSHRIARYAPSCTSAALQNAMGTPDTSMNYTKYTGGSYGPYEQPYSWLSKMGVDDATIDRIFPPSMRPGPIAAEDGTVFGVRTYFTTSKPERDVLKSVRVPMDITTKAPVPCAPSHGTAWQSDNHWLNDMFNAQKTFWAEEIVPGEPEFFDAEMVGTVSDSHKGDLTLQLSVDPLAWGMLEDDVRASKNIAITYWLKSRDPSAVIKVNGTPIAESLNQGESTLNINAMNVLGSSGSGSIAIALSSAAGELRILTTSLT